MLNPKQLPKAYRHWYFYEIENFVGKLFAKMDADIELLNEFEGVMRRLEASTVETELRSFDSGYQKGIADDNSTITKQEQAG